MGRAKRSDQIFQSVRLLFSSSINGSYYYSQTSNESSIKGMTRWNIHDQFFDEWIVFSYFRVVQKLFLKIL